MANNSLTKTSSAIDRLTNSLEKGSLSSLVKARTRRSILLVDCSGSMGESIRSGGTKIQAMRRVVSDLRESHPVPVAAFGIFKSEGGPVKLVETIPGAQDMTPIDDAINFAKRQGATHAVLVTDGIPDSETDAFEAARAFGGPIDCFYIGDGHDRGARFCQELASMTGGTANLTDLAKPKELGTKIAGLLGDGSF